MAQEKNLEAIRHSLAHLLAATVKEQFPDVQLGIGPVIDDGFYYDFKFSEPISDTLLPSLEKRMQELIKEKLPFKGEPVTPAAAKKLFKDQPFKLELIDDLEKDGQTMTVYYTGDVFFDLCRGGHVENTKEINPKAFKLTKLAGAYWKGSEKNPQMTRIYAVAFSSKDELAKYLAMLEEAKKRDHKVLGPALDLFTFSPLVGAGLPLWTPKGTILRDLLDNFVWELRRARGYERVDIPHITKKELYQTSGHWDKFKDELFHIKTREGHEFVMKPMNCPHHTQIYNRRQWSYRELPQRYASTTKVYRDEQSGELAGISRVISITQDDAHVFCRRSQIKAEVEAIVDIIEQFYGTLGFKIEPHLSLHDPAHSEKYLGGPEIWKEMESLLRSITKEKKYTAPEDIGEAAFYGPKIDFVGYDSLGRKLQLATIQLDMNQPERFDLTCISEKGEKERIVMIHAAIMGSLERFLSGYIEHTAGKFPVWLAPVQVMVLAVGEKFEEYAKEVVASLKKDDIRVELSPATESLGKRIRGAELQKIPYVVVVGEKEVAANSVNLRHYHKGALGEMKLPEFILLLKEEIEKKK